MPCVVKRSARQAVKAGPSQRGVSLPQLSRLVAKPPWGPQGVHEIKLDGFRMAARIDNGRVQLLTRTGLDWTGKYVGAVAALANLNVKTAYLDGELCGVDDAGFAELCPYSGRPMESRTMRSPMCGGVSTRLREFMI